MPSGNTLDIVDVLPPLDSFLFLLLFDGDIDAPLVILQFDAAVCGCVTTTGCCFVLRYLNHCQAEQNTVFTNTDYTKKEKTMNA